MLIKYYLSDNINAPFENFALGLGIAWTDPVYNPTKCSVVCVCDDPNGLFGLRERESKVELNWLKINLFLANSTLLCSSSLSLPPSSIQTGPKFCIFMLTQDHGFR